MLRESFEKAKIDDGDEIDFNEFCGLFARGEIDLHLLDDDGKHAGGGVIGAESGLAAKMAAAAAARAASSAAEPEKLGAGAAAGATAGRKSPERRGQTVDEHAEAHRARMMACSTAPDELWASVDEGVLDGATMCFARADSDLDGVLREDEFYAAAHNWAVLEKVWVGADAGARAVQPPRCCGARLRRFRPVGGASPRQQQRQAAGGGDAPPSETPARKRLAAAAKRAVVAAPARVRRRPAPTRTVV